MKWRIPILLSALGRVFPSRWGIDSRTRVRSMTCFVLLRALFLTYMLRRSPRSVNQAEDLSKTISREYGGRRNIGWRRKDVYHLLRYVYTRGCHFLRSSLLSSEFVHNFVLPRALLKLRSSFLRVVSIAGSTGLTVVLPASDSSRPSIMKSLATLRRRITLASA